MHDEELAIIEIRQLSDNARMFLQHEIRNFLHNIVGALHLKSEQTVWDEIWQMKNKLTKWGL